MICVNLTIHERSSGMYSIQGAFVFPSSEQELLALEERIGYVSTALSEEQFAKCIRRRLYRPVAAKGNRSVIDDIKCSICQVKFIYMQSFSITAAKLNFQDSCVI